MSKIDDYSILQILRKRRFGSYGSDIFGHTYVITNKDGVIHERVILSHILVAKYIYEMYWVTGSVDRELVRNV